MKKNITFITLLLAGIVSYTTVADAAQRRVGTTTARGIFSRGSTASLGRSSITKSFKSTPVTCPNATRSFFTESGSTFSNKAKRFRQQAGEFAKTHKGKLFVTGTGTAGATYAVGKSLSERKQRSKILSDLEEFHEALWSYDDSQHAKQNLDAIILRLEENGGINQKNVNDNTPILMVIAAAKVKPEEQKAILKSLIARGAKPGEKELASALNLPSYVHVKDFSWARSIVIRPNLTALKILLPHYDQQTLAALINVVQSRIDDLILNFKSSLSDYKMEQWLELRDYWINKRNEILQSSAFAKLRKEDREDTLAYYDKNIKTYEESVREEQFKILQKEKLLKDKVEPFTQLIDIAHKALNKGKLAGTSAYKEEDWTVAR